MPNRDDRDAVRAPRATAGDTEFARALELQRSGRAAEAEALCRRILADNPGNVGAAVLAAQVTAQRGDIDGGLALLEDVLRRHPNAPAALNGVAALSLRLGRLPAAEAACRRLLATDPDNAAAHFNLGQVADAAGRPAEAAERYRRGLQIHPDLVAARLPLAVALHRL